MVTEVTSDFKFLPLKLAPEFTKTSCVFAIPEILIIPPELVFAFKISASIFKFKIEPSLEVIFKIPFSTASSEVILEP